MLSQLLLSKPVLSKLLTIVSIGLFAARTDAQTWSTFSSKAPHARISAEVVEISQKFYIVGGLIPGTNTIEKSIDVFNPALDRWTILQPTGSFLPGLGGATWSYMGKIYRYSQKSIYVYDPDLNAWQAPAIGGEVPNVPQSVSPVLVGSRVYLLGAKTTMDSLIENYQLPYLEMDDLSWGVLATSGEQKAGLSPAALRKDNFVYLFPGVDLKLSSDVSILDISTNSWTRHMTVTKPFYSNDVTEHEGKLVALVHDGEEGSTLKTLIFDPKDRSLKELSVTRENPQVTSKGLFNLSGTIYSVGNTLNESTQSVGDSITIEALTFANASVSVPKAHNFSIYPIPAVNELHLRASSPPLSIKVIDMTGRQLSNIEGVATRVAAGMATVDVSSLPAGVYTLLCQMDGGWVQHKFIKE
jgi:hypothetical protein